jgi:hypothetical protein
MYLSPHPPPPPWRIRPSGLFPFRINLTARRAPWMRDREQKKRGHTSMFRVGFEPTIPVFERAKIFHVIDRKATVIVFILNYLIKLLIITEYNITHHLFGIKKNYVKM